MTAHTHRQILQMYAEGSGIGRIAHCLNCTILAVAFALHRGVS